ncbi:MAG: acetylxylan esterase [Opitutaceae bacterium]|nr:acetylxylan esterase [Opitutaceae bacterium]
MKILILAPLAAFMLGGATSLHAAEFSAERAQVLALGQLTAAPAVHPAVGFVDRAGLKAIFYDALPWKGKPTRVFAWLGLPANRSGKVPGVVLVHGGGGTAFKEWVQKWNAQGFAAIAIALEGQTDVRNPAGPRTESNPQGWQGHDWSGPARKGIYGDSNEPLADQWMYHAVADTVLAHSLLRSLPEVDATRVGVCGISWGGIITSTVVGIDTRFAFGIPIYGCGALDRAADNYVRALQDNAVYLEVWEPLLRLPRATMPLLWFTGPRDSHFPLDVQPASYRASPGPRMVSVPFGMKHGHGAGWNPPDSYVFAKSVVETGKPWARETAQALRAGTARVEFEVSRAVRGATLVFKRGSDWEESAATLTTSPGRAIATAVVPTGTTAYFFNLDADGPTLSSEYQAVASGREIESVNWPQAAGPNGNWAVTTPHAVPTRWSVERNENIRWRVTLPEAGQSGLAVWEDRLFLTTMKPIAADAEKKTGSDIVLHCFHAATGAPLWQQELAGDPQAPGMYAFGFSDSSSPTPITDGKHVWFWNASGQMGCWTIEGEKVWTRRWTPTVGRPFNKQYEPIKIGGTILNVEPRDSADPLREKDPWNYLRAFDAATGTPRWIAPEGLTHYNTPTLGALPGGGHGILSGRGGYHTVPESPVGLTMTRADGPDAGKALWTWRHPRSDGKALTKPGWDSRFVYVLDETLPELVLLNAADGKEVRRISLLKNVTVTSYDAATATFRTRTGVDLAAENPDYAVFPAWYTNLVTYPHVFFQCFHFKGKRQGKDADIGPRNSIARIHVATAHVEYLELPFPVPHVAGEVSKNNETQYPSMTFNSRGVDVADDKRSGRTGWWWCFNGNPIAVNQFVFFTFMSGRVQVLDGRAERFDATALVALNDLGKFGETWSVNTPSYSRGRLYHRTMKELICIETKP